MEAPNCNDPSTNGPCPACSTSEICILGPLQRSTSYQRGVDRGLIGSARAALLTFNADNYRFHGLE